MVHTVLQDTSRLPTGDPAMMVKIMIDSVDQNHRSGSRSAATPTPLIHKALTERLAALEAQKDIALSTDLPKNAMAG
jgi:hypothetical protein